MDYVLVLGDFLFAEAQYRHGLKTYIGTFIISGFKTRMFDLPGTRPCAMKNVECCRNFLIGYVMFLLAFLLLY